MAHDQLDLYGERQRHEENPEYRKVLDHTFSDPLFLDETPSLQEIGPLMHFMARHDPEGLRLYRKHLLKTDIKFKLSSVLRSRLHSALKHLKRYRVFGIVKTVSAVKDLGCSLAELQVHIESQFKTGMNWENYGRSRGQWSIDHIVPISSFNLACTKDFLKAVHFTNLQPLWNEGKNGQWAKSNKLPEVDQTNADHQH